MNSFRNYIVYGCGIGEHTNSYVYHGFHKAFKAMGFNSYWLNDNSDVSGIDFSNSLFFTEWQHCKNMLKRKDCKYILHNCDPKDYEGLDYLHLQTFNDFCKQGTCTWHKHGVPERINDYTYYLKGPKEERTLFQPWATDLLSSEINLHDAEYKRTNESHFIGSLGDGIYGNINEINGFKRACEENNIKFVHNQVHSCSFEENRELIKKSYLAPSIHGTEQVRVGLPTCRVFKNISYGALGGTNCEASARIFDGNMIYNQDPYQLFYDMQKEMNNYKRIKNMMQIVRDKHTYINRVESILEVL